MSDSFSCLEIQYRIELYRYTVLTQVRYSSANTLTDLDFEVTPTQHNKQPTQMKDEHQRQRQAISRIPKTPLPKIESSHTQVLAKQVRLAGGGDSTTRLDVQQNDFIVTANSNCGISLYSIHAQNDVPVDDANTNITIKDEAESVPAMVRYPLWSNFAASGQKSSHAKFIARDIIACTQEGGDVTTWCARSKSRLDYLTVKYVIFSWTKCIVSETEFVAGGREGHICFFTHKHGAELKHVKRIWKAHRDHISSLTCFGKFFVSTSSDGTARVWDVESKKRIHTLYHDGPVYYSAISDPYLMTSSVRHSDDCCELRLYHIDQHKFSLVKLFCSRESIYMPRFLNNNLIMYWRNCMSNETDDDVLFFFRLDTEAVVAQLKVHCSFVYDYAMLDDGRLVVCGSSDSRAVVATLPRHLRRFLDRESAKNSCNEANRKFCAIV